MRPTVEERERIRRRTDWLKSGRADSAKSRARTSHANGGFGGAPQPYDGGFEDTPQPYDGGFGDTPQPRQRRI